ncbi:hypothetical protein [Actinoplanes sp. NPDC023714]|uniref:hypothetical protein n=1 Tax=Actinoplanes sp. NPDC023714 TaxID=3154322 RepID=UPI0034024114
MIYAVLLFALAATTVTWWIVGDQTDPEAASLGVPLDYALRPLPLSTGQERLIGIAATVLLIAAVAVMIAAVVRRRADPLWLLLLLPLSLAAAIAGACHRIFTAGTIGANIGAGLVTFFVIPVGVVMLLLAGLVLIAIHRRKR